jgi:hypothetical protein
MHTIAAPLDLGAPPKPPKKALVWTGPARPRAAGAAVRERRAPPRRNPGASARASAPEDRTNEDIAVSAVRAWKCGVAIRHR